MFRTVYLKTLYDQRRGLTGWSLAITILVTIESALWPSFRDMPGLTEMYANFPAELRELFDLEAMTTGLGFLNAELYTLLLPALFIVYGVGRGARLVAGEEEDGTLDLLLVTPVSAGRIVAEKAVALATSIFALAATLLISTVAMSLLFGLGIGVGEAATGALAMALLGFEYGALSLAVGVITGRKAAAIAFATLAAVGGYVLYAAGLLVSSLEPWQPLSPFHQALQGGPLGAGLPLSYLWLLLGSAVLIAAALPVLDRRDIAAHN